MIQSVSGCNRLLFEMLYKYFQSNVTNLFVDIQSVYIVKDVITLSQSESIYIAFQFDYVTGCNQ
jgi:hypothetical protein